MKYLTKDEFLTWRYFVRVNNKYGEDISEKVENEYKL